ncbi:MAG: hypothetical protein ABI142_11195 [Bryocella sp.]
MLLASHLAVLAQSDCSLFSRCGADRALDVLYGVSAFLVLLLAAVGGVAIYLYRRNRGDGKR